MSATPESRVRAAPAAADAPQQQARVPDFFIVGHHKSGTTALWRMLMSHPQVFMPQLKEPRYLAADLRAISPPPPGWPQTLEQYLALFSPARPDQLAGEASPSYLRSRTAARAIAELQPRARIVAIFREPASFVRSLHLQLLQEGVERERDLGRALEREAIERAGERVLRYSDHVRYAEQLRRYHEVFDREQVLVLIYEELRADNRAALRSVLDFLGLAAAEVPLLEANRSVAVRAVRLDRALRELARGQGTLARALRASAVALTPRDARRRALALLRRRVIYGEPPPVEERVMASLRARYREQVVALGDYLGRDLLALWGYEGG